MQIHPVIYNFLFYIIPYLSREWKKGLLCSRPFYVWLLVVLHPILDLGLSQTQDVLSGVQRSLATTDVQEVQALGGLVQILLVTGGIAQLAERVSLDQSCGLGVVLLLADDLLHGMNLLSDKSISHGCYYTLFGKEIKG